MVITLHTNNIINTEAEFALAARIQGDVVGG